MKMFCLTPRNVYLRRWSPGSLLLVAGILLSLGWICRDGTISKTITKSLQWRPSQRPSLPSVPLWIVPDVTSLPNTAIEIPLNWTIFVPKGLRGLSSCDSCYHEQVENLPQVQWVKDSVTSHNASSPGRDQQTKMARLLFLISRGAVGILMTSDLPSTNNSLSRLILDNQPEGVTGIVYVGSGLASGVSHFHSTEKKPATHKRQPCRYMIRKRMNPIFTVGVRCASAPYDSEGKILTLTDSKAPPVFSSRPKFSITKFSDAFFEYEGFWALILTLVPQGRQLTSRWGLWAQRMLMEMGGEVGLTSLQCPLPGDSSPTVIDIASKAPDQKTKLMRVFVSEWKCDPAVSFYACAIQLVADAVEAYLMEKTDVDLLKIWLTTLRETGYREPNRKKMEGEPVQNYLPGCIIHSPAPDLTFVNSSQPKRNLFPNIFPKCQHLPKRPGVPDPFGEHSLSKPSRVKDIALVIIFYDSSIYSNILFLHDIYPKYFPHLIYCGPDWTSFYAFYKTFPAPLTYIEVPNTRGFVAYECVSRAIMMNYDVSGYLEMADDVILNPWTLGDIPRDIFWFQKDLKIANRHQQIMHDFALPYPFPWWPWTVQGQIWGAKAMERVWDRFKEILTLPSSSSNDSNSSSSTSSSSSSHYNESKEILTVFLETLRQNSGNSDNFFYCSSDIFYVPNKFRREWAWLSEIFFKNNVFLDIAVPTLMNGLDRTVRILRMEGVYLWYNDRENYPAHYRHYHLFLHPWKMGWINRSDHANFLCYHVLPHVIADRTNVTGHA